MSSNPINLTIRFLLELAAMASIGLWGWRQGDSGFRFLLGIGLPILAAVVWGTFAVPNDPSRSGKAPVPVSGIIRLIMELTIFGFAAWALFNLGYLKLSLAIGIIIVLHYIVSYDRIHWLVSKKK